MSVVNAIVAVFPTNPQIVTRPYPTLPADGFLLVQPTVWAINPADAYYASLEG